MVKSGDPLGDEETSEYGSHVSVVGKDASCQQFPKGRGLEGRGGCGIFKFFSSCCCVPGPVVLKQNTFALQGIWQRLETFGVVLSGG